MLTDENLVENLKQIDLEADLREYLNRKVQSIQGQAEGSMLRDVILYGVHRDFTDHTKYTYDIKINDNMDICVFF